MFSLFNGNLATQLQKCPFYLFKISLWNSILFLFTVTLEELKTIADELRPYTADAMKIEVAPWIRDYVVNIEDLFTDLTIEKIHNKPAWQDIKRLNHYRELFEESKLTERVCGSDLPELDTSSSKDSQIDSCISNYSKPADIFVTFPHRTIQEFLGALYLILILNRTKEIEPLLKRFEPILLNNPLFLQFCLWFLCDDQNYFSFANRHAVYQSLISFCIDIVNCQVLNLDELNDTHAALGVSLFSATDRLHVSFFTDILVKCKKTSKLFLPDIHCNTLDSTLR